MRPKLVFFGTGPVSLHCLAGVHEAFTLEAIITKPDRVAPGGRQHEHPVRAWAEAHQVPVYQVANKVELAALVTPGRLESQVGLVVDFGLIIPEVVIAAFPLGIINSHFSLLPLLRGADPISFAILEGHARTGVSLMQIVSQLDEGELIAQEALAVAAHITTPELTEQLGDVSNRLLREHLGRYITGEITPWPQNPDITPTYTRRLTKEDGRLDWTKPATQLEREVRAFIGWPGSHTELLGRTVTVTAAGVTVLPTPPPAPGTVLHEAGRLIVATSAGGFEILQLTPAGKRSMAADAFLRGLTP